MWYKYCQNLKFNPITEQGYFNWESQIGKERTNPNDIMFDIIKKPQYGENVYEVVAMVRNKQVGQLRFALLSDKDTIYLCGTGVNEAYRRLGIGQMLFTELLKYLQKNHLDYKKIDGAIGSVEAFDAQIKALGMPSKMESGGGSSSINFPTTNEGIEQARKHYENDGYVYLTNSIRREDNTIHPKSKINDDKNFQKELF